RLSSAHPTLATHLRATAESDEWNGRSSIFSRAWAWGRAQTWFDARRDDGAQERLTEELNEAIQSMGRATATLVAEEAWGQCLLRMTASQERALRSYKENIDQIGAGQGKFKDRYAAAARQAMVQARGAVPAWIMPLREVVETIPPDQNSFDVVIVDEASQASIEALFLLWLAPRVIVVGDERQCAPSQVVRGELQPIFDRLDDYLADVPEYLRLAFTPKSNLFSLLATRFGGVVRLREHFRCMPEIITWSSKQFYADAPLVPLRQFGADRLPPLRTVYVPAAVTEGSSTRLRNRAEAEAIAAKIVDCIHDPAYDGRTFGVVVLQGSGQVRLIEDLLTAAVPAAEWERRRLRVGTPPDFQGDERDVVFLSMVAAERRPALTSREWQRRFNVAASRAKDQMWLFHSVKLDLLSPNDLRRSLLSYMLNPPAPLTTSDFDDLHWDSELREPFQSKFEQRVFIALRDRGYHVTPQYEVNGKFIDLVVTGAKGQLAVECDGPHHETREQQIADMDRELELRRAGWQFWRVRGSDFYLDPEKALSSLWETLEQRGIRPGDLATVESAEPIDTEPWEQAPLSDEEGLDGLDGEDPSELDVNPHAWTPGGRTASRAVRTGEAEAIVLDLSSDVTASEIRRWARQNGMQVGDRGRLHPDVIKAWNRAHPDRQF
ncbi:MAG TPA: histone-like nucleoid-structuring protein Lsr2, partial [Rhodothermales bacterium]